MTLMNTPSNKSKRSFWTQGRARNWKRLLHRYWIMPYAKIAVWTPEIYPDFLCIGAPRTGTTWLHERLSLHPDIHLPEAKELHFFDTPLKQEFKGRLVLFWLDKLCSFNMNNPAHWRWYSLQFMMGKGQCKGDMTPAYSVLREERVKLIATRLPSLKIIYILRDPVERNWSALKKYLWSTFQIVPSEVDSTNSLLELTMRPQMIARSNYQKIIETWESYFKDRILYLFYDDIKDNPREQLNAVCRFLEVDPLKLPDPGSDRKRVYASPESEMPEDVHIALEKQYEVQISFLEKKFDRDLNHWRRS